MTTRILMTRRTAGLTARGTRAPLPSPEALAPLMLDSYRGTPDDEGESLADAIEVLRQAFGGAYGPVIADASAVALDDGEPVGAIVVADGPRAPFIAFVFTHPDHVRRGIARDLIANACAVLLAQGNESLELYVNEANEGAIRCYEKLGFLAVAEPLAERDSAEDER